MWTGVGAIEPDSVVRLERDGTSSLVSRRQLPTAHSSRAAAVDSVRLSLANGVASRVSAAGREGLALDLSGGLDSTSLCFLAQAAGAAAFTTVTHVDPGVGNDDEVWAARASRELAGASRLLLGEAETGTQFASAAASGFECDEPLWELRTYGIFGRLAEVLKEHGVLIHIAGFGGDEVFRTPAIYLYGLIRRRPVLGVSHLRGMRAIARWRWPGIAQGLTDRRSYDRWLLGEAPSLRHQFEPFDFPIGWSTPLRLPPWVTKAGEEAVRSLILEVGADAEPLGETREAHSAMERIRQVALAVRQVNQILQRQGVSLAAPFLDDSVLSAALQVAPEERSTPWSYKPLLTEAMRGIVPAAILGRVTKGDASSEVYAGLRRNLPQLLELCTDSILATRGLIDEAELRRVLLRPLSPEVDLSAVSNTLSTEAWLRSRAAAPDWAAGVPTESYSKKNSAEEASSA